MEKKMETTIGFRVLGLSRSGKEDGNDCDGLYRDCTMIKGLR